ncbi:fibroblast growth factor receptor 1-like [Sparus aurata]|uniref:fibroblast growth factor receptor 1-like n=1 Tax=Sparus aurata TaxID=8175 RepID=UPI0011C1922D|nr:fibroblast growth factor receptor 1-like [Sparus aurata]
MIDFRRPVDVTVGETVDLPCLGAADNLNIQWLKSDFEHWNDNWTRVFGDSITSVMDDVEGRSQVVKTSSGLRIYNFTLTRFKYYTCLVMNQQQCVSSHTVELDLPSESILHTVGETAVLQCPAAEFTDNQSPLWSKRNKNFSPDSEVGKSYSLVLSSLQLNHSGSYTCKIYNHVQLIHLTVCPESDPPAVELFSEGDNVTFRCSGWEEGWTHSWWIKSDQTEGKLLDEYDLTFDMWSRLNSFEDDGLLILSNVSLEDTGEYWCVVTDQSAQCVSSSRTVLQSREPSSSVQLRQTVNKQTVCSYLLIIMVCHLLYM